MMRRDVTFEVAPPIGAGAVPLAPWPCAARDQRVEGFDVCNLQVEKRATTNGPHHEYSMTPNGMAPVLRYAVDIAPGGGVTNPETRILLDEVSK